jgi:hypothetical protein
MSKKYTVEPRYLPVYGWRYCVFEDRERIHHYSTRREAEAVRESLVRNQAKETFAPSVAFREGLNKSHLARVLEAQRMVG